MRTFTIWFVIAFSILGQECSGILTVVPSNTAVHEGSETVLQCRTNTTPTTNTGSLLWRTQLSENDTIMTIYTGHKFVRNITKDLYNISNTTKGQSDLRITADNTTARRYFCEESEVSNAIYSAELIVLASDPACSIINDRTTNLRMECRLLYFGNWAPVMEWRQVSGEMENEMKLINEGITSNTSKYTVISTLTVQRKETRSKYMCTTRFNAIGRPRSTTATNIPEYSYNWTYLDFELNTSSITAESSSTQQFSTDSEIPTTTPADPSSTDSLKPILICMTILCILLVIMVCITCKKTNEGCISKCLHSNRRQNRAETSTTVALNGVDERISPRVSDEGGDNTYVPVWQGTNYLQLCPGSVASLPVAKSEQGDEPTSSTRYMGDDGTVYMEMNGFRRQPTSAPQIHPTTHSSVVYARIDHTLSPPPPK